MIDFVNSPYRGAEMLPLERCKLYNWVLESTPAMVLEVGTGSGGGTSYIAEAIKDIGTGYILTRDPLRKPNDDFFKTYPFVDYRKCRSDVIIEEVIERGLCIDFIFFDGPEDPDVALRDIKRLEQWIITGTLFAMHDWETTKRKYDGAISTKAEKIRPYMEESEHWKEVEVLSGQTIQSVGLCLYKYIK